jgi:hypothetical protein
MAWPTAWGWPGGCVDHTGMPRMVAHRCDGQAARSMNTVSAVVALAWRVSLPPS